ncbi:MAG TPA: type II toxin-antitoxin system death-on-curing family toxin [Ancylobacter sp.]
MNEPLWLETAAVADIGEAVVRATGEPFLIRDAGLLESAVMVPRNRWHYEDDDDIARLGLALALAIARNHPFEQGNKRAAWFAMLAFLALNGTALKNEDDLAYADLFVEVVTGAQPPEHLLARLHLTGPY